jgi:outer membrane protein
MEENNNKQEMANEVNNTNTTNNLPNNEMDNNVKQDTAETCKDKKEGCKCNKALVIITLVVAIAALVVALIGLFKNNNSDNTANTKVGKIVQSGNMKIAYINTDTIMAKYTMAVEMQKELKAKQTNLENSLKNQYTQLQKEEQEYLKTGQNLTLTQQKAKEKEFQQREQQLSQAMQQQPAQFQQEVAAQNEKLLNAVLAFVNDYNAKHDKYNIILSYSKYNGPTLYIDKGLDITDEIVKGLNEEYKNVKDK